VNDNTKYCAQEVRQENWDCSLTDGDKVSKCFDFCKGYKFCAFDAHAAGTVNGYRCCQRSNVCEQVVDSKDNRKYEIYRAQWQLLVKHDSTSRQFFPKNTLTYKSSNGKLMMDLDQDYAKFRAAGDGKMKLKLVYPEFATNKAAYPLGNGKKNLVWKQSSSPLDSTVQGYSIAPNRQHDFDGGDDFKGLCRSSASSSTLLDGQPEHGYWFYAVGAYSSWNGADKFPGPRGSQKVDYYAGGQAQVSQMELWVHIPPTPEVWTLLAKHDSTSNEFFPKNTLTYKSNNGKLILNLEQDYSQFRGTDGKMTMKLVYPEFTNQQKFPKAKGHTDLVWKQSSSPLENSVKGYSIKQNTQHDWDGGDDFKGICRSSYGGTVLDGQPEHGYWFYAIGAHQSWPKAAHFPGPRGSQNVAYGNDGSGVQQMELWVQQVKTKSPTKSPTTKTPTMTPTSRPTESPTERCNANNCMNWTCVDWCECFDKADEPTYQSYAGCQDDNDDTCICFENDEHDLNGERHRKINYNQDAVDAGTATMIEGTEIHTATKQNHYQEATESPTKSPTTNPYLIKELVLSNGNTLKRFSNKHLDLTGGHVRAHTMQANFCAMQGGRLPTFADICPNGEYGQPAMGCVAAADHSWVPFSKNVNSYAFISCGGHNGMVCKDHVKHHGNPIWGNKGDVYGSQVECIIPQR
jgi:hypothetical protein